MSITHSHEKVYNCGGFVYEPIVKESIVASFPKFTFSISLPKVKRLIFNPPATIVYWTDGTKTVVKAQDEEFDEEKGLAMAFMKKNSKDWNKYGKIIKNAERPYQTKK